MQVVPVVPWSMARITDGSLPSGHIHPYEVEQLATAMDEAGKRLSRGTMIEIELYLHHPMTCPCGIDCHAYLHAEPTRKREHIGEHTRSQSPLPRYRSLQLKTTTPTNRP